MQKKHLIGYPLTALLAIGIGAATGTSGGASGQATMSAPTATVTTTATVTAAAPASGPASPPAPTAAPAATTTSAKAEIPGDGTFQVGVDIAPGTYVSEAPASEMCYWARLSGQDSVGGIIANNLSKGRSVVTIAATDKFFEVRGCNPWTKR